MSTDLVDYLYQEAKEKSLEIEIEARKDYESKLRSIVAEKNAIIDTRYEKQDHDKETEYKQEYSKIKNKIKTNRLIARNKALIKLMNLTQISLLKKCRSDNAYYTDLLKKLIVEGLVKMMEPMVIVYCLQRDKILVQEVLAPCKQEFEELTFKQLGKKKEIELQLCEKNFLLERDLPDLSSVDIAAITDDNENQIKISNKEDDKYW